METVFLIFLLIYIVRVIIALAINTARHPEDTKSMFCNFWIIKYPWKWIVSDRIKSRMRW